MPCRQAVTSLGRSQFQLHVSDVTTCLHCRCVLQKNQEHLRKCPLWDAVTYTSLVATPGLVYVKENKGFTTPGIILKSTLWSSFTCKYPRPLTLEKFVPDEFYPGAGPFPFHPRQASTQQGVSACCKTLALTVPRLCCRHQH